MATWSKAASHFLGPPISAIHRGLNQFYNPALYTPPAKKELSREDRCAVRLTIAPVVPCQVVSLLYPSSLLRTASWRTWVVHPSYRPGTGFGQFMDCTSPRKVIRSSSAPMQSRSFPPLTGTSWHRLLLLRPSVSTPRSRRQTWPFGTLPVIVEGSS